MRAGEIEGWGEEGRGEGIANPQAFVGVGWSARGRFESAPRLLRAAAWVLGAAVWVLALGLEAWRRRATVWSCFSA